MADRRSFEQIAMPHLDAVFRAAMVLCGRAALAEDLAQTTFLKAWQRFDTFQPGTKCKTWLMTILRNTWFDELRHRRVTGPGVSIENDLPEPPQPPRTAWTDASDLLENFGDQEIIRALADLPEQQRLALFLVDVEGLSHEEVAEITGTAVGTVKSRSSRARAALRDKLSDLARDRGLVGRRP